MQAAIQNMQPGQLEDGTAIGTAIAEPSTGETMGQSAEKMAKLNAIARQARALPLPDASVDALAVRHRPALSSLRRAAAAQHKTR